MPSMSVMLGTTDEQVMALAVEQARIVVSADTDFGELLVDVTEDLLAGAIVVIVEDRIRIRRLPIR